MKSYIIAYDISKNRDRYVISKELFKYGLRTQKSLFEIDLSSSELKGLKEFLKEFNTDNNKIHIYRVHYNQIKRLGDVEYLASDDFII